ncbi:hypothetical protein N7527_008174 [Penicillium freii]|nr:hypothetical protein N7527_008174 [Penicillium freii]
MCHLLTIRARRTQALFCPFKSVHRQGDILADVELSAALEAVGTDVAFHVFEGHMQMLLRLGDPTYPATLVMDNWLKVRVPVTIPST